MSTSSSSSGINPFLISTISDMTYEMNFQQQREEEKVGQQPISKFSTTPSPKSQKDQIILSSSSDNLKSSTEGTVHSLTDTQLAEKYQFIEEVGYGNWGSVWKCRPRNEDPSTSNLVAIKLVHRSKDSTSNARIRSLWNEYEAVQSLDHDCSGVINFYNFNITPSYVSIVMDYHPRLIPIGMSESIAKPYFRQLISAVEYLHKRGCSHNDIKPANILLSMDDVPILVDFGFAQKYSDQSDNFTSSLSWGTIEYLSPERAKGFYHNESLSDIWSLGVTMYEIVVGRTPFECNQLEEFVTKDAVESYYRRTLTGEFFGEIKISSEFQSLIGSMIEPLIELRLPNCGIGLQHRFFREEPVLSFPTNSKHTSTSTSLQTPALPTPSPLSSPSKKVYKKLIKVEEKPKSKPLVIYQDPENSTTPIRISPSKSNSRHLTPRNIYNTTSTPTKSTSAPTKTRTPTSKSKSIPQVQIISQIPRSSQSFSSSTTNNFDDITPTKSKPKSIAITSTSGLRSPIINPSRDSCIVDASTSLDGIRNQILETKSFDTTSSNSNLGVEEVEEESFPISRSAKRSSEVESDLEFNNEESFDLSWTQIEVPTPILSSTSTSTSPSTSSTTSTLATNSNKSFTQSVSTSTLSRKNSIVSTLFSNLTLSLNKSKSHSDLSEIRTVGDQEGEKLRRKGWKKNVKNFLI